MPRTNGDASKVKYSNLISTLSERNAELEQKYYIEMQAKTEAYIFILEQGMLDAFAMSQGHQALQMTSEDVALLIEVSRAHLDAIKSVTPRQS